MRSTRTPGRQLRWLKPLAVCALLFAGVVSSLLGSTTICICDDGCVCLESGPGAAWNVAPDASGASGPAYAGGCFCSGCTDIVLCADKPGKLPAAALHQAAAPVIVLAGAALAAAPRGKANVCRARQPRAPDLALAIVHAAQLLI